MGLEKGKKWQLPSLQSNTRVPTGSLFLNKYDNNPIQVAEWKWAERPGT